MAASITTSSVVEEVASAAGGDLSVNPLCHMLLAWQSLICARGCIFSVKLTVSDFFGKRRVFPKLVVSTIFARPHFLKLAVRNTENRIPRNTVF